MSGRAFLPDHPDLFLTYCGMETDLIFNRGVDLPGFASFPLLATDARHLVEQYAIQAVALGHQTGTGVILESATWMANRDRAAHVGYRPEQLAAVNRDAIGLLAEVRARAGGLPILISANVGPRSDAYAPNTEMTVPEAQAYHSEQIVALSGTEVDVISGYTMADPAEAAGVAKAADATGTSCVISFTVETDGRLPGGMALSDAMAFVDRETDAYPAYYMINCAHPDHFEAVLDGGPWMDRIGGIVANASRCSHEELDNAKELDAGNPEELGAQLIALRRRFPQLRTLGGCCGTDWRHMQQIAKAASAQ